MKCFDIYTEQSPSNLQNQSESFHPSDSLTQQNEQPLPRSLPQYLPVVSVPSHQLTICPARPPRLDADTMGIAGLVDLINTPCEIHVCTSA